MKLTTKLLGAAMSIALLGGVMTLAPRAGIAAQAQTQAQTQSAKQIVDQAKAQGLVGERLDGYVGFVKSDVSADIRAAVNEINIKRKSIYTRLAREQNVAVSDVAGLTGEKLVAKARSGQMVFLGDGQWHVVGQ